MAALILALFTSGLAAINTIWLGPWSSKHQDVVLNDAKANPSLAALGGGQFKSSNDGNSALFIGNVAGKEFNRVFWHNCARMVTSAPQWWWPIAAI